jgi:hypothetical protein
MSPYVKVTARDVPDVDGCIRTMHQELSALGDRYDELRSCRFHLAPAAEGFEAHLELVFPQDQIIVNAAAPVAARAVKDVVAAATRRIDQPRPSRARS